MGYKKPERRDLSELLHPHNQAGQMQRDGWRLRTRCLHCQLELLCDYEVLIRMNGRAFRPWGRTTRCRRVGCDGMMIFMGSPPGWHLAFWPLWSSPDGSAPPHVRDARDGHEAKDSLDP
jgi:hypothetical protein